ncbi:MAG: SDR family oxidoreductase, partial [Eggerthellaceae bacterium]|nr:SDR family oxidoreductase [Eggerthellaceae bacterium]
MGLLEGKTAVITGARRGIGRATVAAFAREGASVWACARSRDEEFEAFCESLAQRHSTRITPVYFDLELSDEIARGVKEVRSSREPVTTLVNCAGIVAPSASFPMTKRDEFRRVIDVNLTRQVEVTQYFLRLLSDGGAIVNLSSIAAMRGMPGQYAYACSKGAVETWTRMLAQELGPRQIRVNAVAPGFVDTEMGNRAAGDL